MIALKSLLARDHGQSDGREPLGFLGRLHARSKNKVYLVDYTGRKLAHCGGGAMIRNLSFKQPQDISRLWKD